MKVRVLTSIGMAVIGIPILIFSQYIVFPIVLSLIAFLGVFEMLRTLGIGKNLFISIPAYIFALFFPFYAYFVKAEQLVEYILILAMVFFAYLLYLFALGVFMRGKLQFSAISEAFATVFYIVTAFTALCVLRYMTNGIWNLSLVFVGAWGCDVFAYLVGSMIGKHKLIPEISPKKTIEGSIGGIVFAAIGYLLFGFILSKTVALTPNYLILGIAGVLIAIVAQIGDLIASFIKRERGVKDYGRIFPGHGGIMDRFDSVLAVSTVLMAVCILFPPFS